MRFTGGLGFRSKHVSVDLAGVHGSRDMRYFPYDPDLVAPTQVSRTDTRGVLTIAYRP